MGIDDVLEEAEQKMQLAVEHVKVDFALLRTNQASATMFMKIAVTYFGTPTPLSQLASIAVSDAQTVIIKPYDESVTQAIEKALRSSDLGVNPAPEGTALRVAIPAMTGERRKAIARVVRAKSEDAKIAVRHIRRKAKTEIDVLVKAGTLGVDDGQRAEKTLDELTRACGSQIDALAKHKENEIMEL